MKTHILKTSWSQNSRLLETHFIPQSKTHVKPPAWKNLFMSYNLVTCHVIFFQITKSCNIYGLAFVTNREKSLHICHTISPFQICIYKMLSCNTMSLSLHLAFWNTQCLIWYINFNSPLILSMYFHFQGKGKTQWLCQVGKMSLTSETENKYTMPWQIAQHFQMKHPSSLLSYFNKERTKQ